MWRAVAIRRAARHWIVFAPSTKEHQVLLIEIAPQRPVWRIESEQLPLSHLLREPAAILSNELFALRRREFGVLSFEGFDKPGREGFRIGELEARWEGEGLKGHAAYQIRSSGLSIALPNYATTAAVSAWQFVGCDGQGLFACATAAGAKFLVDADQTPDHGARIPLVDAQLPWPTLTKNTLRET